jgi:hypothetical protein
MRKFIWLAALLAGAAIVSESPAQTQTSTTSTSTSSTTTSSNQPSFISPGTYLGSSFRLSDLIPSFRNPFATRAVIGSSNVPEPGSKEYFKAFGFRAVR